MSNNATWYQSTHTLRIIGDKDPSLEHIKHLHDGLLADLVEAVMNGALPDREALRKVYGLPPLKLMIVIDYGKTLEQVLEAGKYDWVNSDVTPDRFPIKGTGVVEREAKIVHFGRICLPSKSRRSSKRELAPRHSRRIARVWIDISRNAEKISDRGSRVVCGRLRRSLCRLPDQGRLGAPRRPRQVGWWVGRRLPFPCLRKIVL